MNNEKTSLKKIISNHFFDFFMLFLAVSLGFLVDNYRDEQNSKSIATEMALDVIEDIKSDTAAIQDMLLHCEHKQHRLDTLFNLINDDITHFDDTVIYRLSAYVNKRPWFERHGSTIYLLLNAGYLSSFSKDASVCITTYDLECQKLFALLEIEKSTLNNKVVPFLQQVFHTENFVSIIHSNTFVCKPELRNWNQDTRWLYHNYITEMQILNNNILQYYQQLLAQATLTIQILQKEYMLEQG
jgi:hypothetical protein